MADGTRQGAIGRDALTGVLTMDELKFDCPCCRKTLGADESMRGQIIDCPSCLKALEVPQGVLYSKAANPIIGITSKKINEKKKPMISRLFGKVIFWKRLQSAPTSGNDGTGLLNIRQRRILKIGLTLIALSFLFPFFERRLVADYSMRWPIGYRFYLIPPSASSPYYSSINTELFWMQVITLTIITVGFVFLYGDRRVSKMDNDSRA